MKSHLIYPSFLRGEIDIPPSKSQTIRAILFASLAKGTTTIYNYLHSLDSRAMIEGCIQLGAKIEEERTHLHVEGTGGVLLSSENIINAKNSGLVFRLIGAISSLSNGYTIITGDRSLRLNRCNQSLLDGMRQLGGLAISLREGGYAPIIIKGPIKEGRVKIDGADSQPVSALIIASCFVDGEVEIEVENPGEKPWVGLTLSWLDRLNIKYENYDFKKFKIVGPNRLKSFRYTVSGDFSSSLFPIVAAIITDSEICVTNMDINDPQGDKKALEILQEMGANIEVTSNSIKVKRGSYLIGRDIDINDIIDCLPLFAVVGCFARGRTRIYNGNIARKKESDRIFAICSQLKRMGARIEEKRDGLEVEFSKLIGTRVFSYEDHRIAMSLTVAALKAKGKTIVEGVECTHKSYPNFFQDMKRLGATIL